MNNNTLLIIGAFLLVIFIMNNKKSSETSSSPPPRSSSGSSSSGSSPPPPAPPPPAPPPPAPSPLPPSGNTTNSIKDCTIVSTDDIKAGKTKKAYIYSKKSGYMTFDKSVFDKDLATTYDIGISGKYITAKADKKGYWGNLLASSQVSLEFDDVNLSNIFLCYVHELKYSAQRIRLREPHGSYIYITDKGGFGLSSTPSKDTELVLMNYNDNGSLYDGDKVSIGRGEFVISDPTSEGVKVRAQLAKYRSKFIIEKTFSKGGIVSSNDTVGIKNVKTNNFLTSVKKGLAAYLLMDSFYLGDNEEFTIIFI